jgi:serine/threonine protein kinase
MRYSAIGCGPWLGVASWRTRRHWPAVALSRSVARERGKGQRVAAGAVASGGSLDWLLRALVELPPGTELPCLAGDVVGGYVLGERIGRGSFSVVHEATDARGRTVAIKLLRPARVQPGALEREAMLVRRLDHPNVVALHDHGVADGASFLVLERLRGESLDQRLLRGPIAVAAALDIAVAVARGLAHAHAAGVVHADLKPANVFLCDDGRVKVLDFGLAELHVGGAPANDGGGGTPAYMAPERFRGGRPSFASDVFALGTLLYETVQGERPWRELSDGPAPSLSSLPSRLQALLARALDERPGARQQRL